jgi:hypothetical protein
VVVQKPGFAKENRSDVQLLVNESVTLDFKLSVARASQTIEVTGVAPELNTTNATLADVVQHQQIVDLPLKGRNFTQLTLLTPGRGASGIKSAGYTHGPAASRCDQSVCKWTERPAK